jgi:hypothetical protein
MRRTIAVLLTAVALVAVACGSSSETKTPSTQAPVAQATTAPAAPAASVEAATDDIGVNLVVAPAVKGRVDEALVLDAYRRAVAQGERDFGITPKRTVTLYIDPDSAIGLEDALGLSAGNSIHLRAGRTQRMDSLMPLMMHEYTHVLQHQIARLRPQWWIEGQAEHESQRVLDPGKSTQAQKSLFRSLASDVRAGRAPSLNEDLRGSGAWKDYIDKSGSGKAYGWGQAAVSFIESKAGFEGVARLMKDTTGPNSLTSWDEAVQRETGLDPEQFEAGLKSWLVQQNA